MCGGEVLGTGSRWILRIGWKGERAPVRYFFSNGQLKCVTCGNLVKFEDTFVREKVNA